jgi:hypothetical protein
VPRCVRPAARPFAVAAPEGAGVRIGQVHDLGMPITLRGVRTGHVHDLGTQITLRGVRIGQVHDLGT